jgi:pimeloyl-ACP methyl ester carboxylesterase
MVMGLFRGKRDFSISSSGLDLVEVVRLGGVDQSILIQAEDVTKPVLLFVHGGPCMPVPGVVSRGQDYMVSTTTKELVKHYVVVFWDQRGAGKSYQKSIPSKTFRTEHYFQDCLELIDYLRTRFQREKVYLAGHSWGSVIGLTAASRIPEKLHGYVGISQVLNWTNNDQLCYQWLKTKAESANDQKTLTKLHELGQPPYLEVKKWTDFRRPLIKYNSMIYTSDTVKHPGMLGAFKIFLNSEEYSLKDIFHSFYSSYNLTYTQDLIEDFAKINLDALRRIDIPVAFLHGAHDFHVDGRPVESFYQKLEAPQGKEMVWYEKSSHMFHPEDARGIEKFLIQFAKTKTEVLV